MDLETQDQDGWLAVEEEDDANGADFSWMTVENHDRAVSKEAISPNNLVRNDQPQKQVADISVKMVEFETMQPDDFSLLHVKSVQEPGLLWDSLTEFFEVQENLDPEVNEQAKVVTGHYYDTPQECKFMAGVYLVDDKDAQEQSVVDFRRLSGDAFLMNDFFHLVVDWLLKNEMVEPEENSDDEYEISDDEPLSDVEDMDGFNVEPLNPFKRYLEFNYDEGLLHMWISRFKDSHMEDKDYVMKMMSFNAEHEGNREFMLRKSAGELKELIETQLTQKKDWNSAPITRNTCLLLKNLSLSEDMVVGEETIKAVCEAMANWCPGQQSSPVIGEVRESRQSMIEIAQFYDNLVTSKKCEPDFFANVMQETLDSDQMNAIVSFTSNREEEILKNFGEFVENLTTPMN
jgi:hypothetical protein